MAAPEAADPLLMLGVGLIGEEEGALPRRPAPSSVSAWGRDGPCSRGPWHRPRWGGRGPLHVGPGLGAAGPGLLGAGARPAALGPCARGLVWGLPGREAGPGTLEAS